VVTKSEVEAVRLYILAAKQDNAMAQISLGEHVIYHPWYR
jgi:TPR repeat protein